MKIIKKGFGAVLTDNERIYIDFTIDALLKHADPEADITLDKRDEVIRVVITPSTPEFKQSIINDILNGHRLLGLKVTFSKSLKISKSVAYTVEF